MICVLSSPSSQIFAWQSHVSSQALSNRCFLDFVPFLTVFLIRKVGQKYLVHDY